jgi:hypothetical protein
MTKEDFIRREMNIWGEDYIFSLIDRGYDPVQLVIEGKLRWWWVLPTHITSGEDHTNQLLTQA